MILLNLDLTLLTPTPYKSASTVKARVRPALPQTEKSQILSSLFRRSPPPPLRKEQLVAKDLMSPSQHRFHPILPHQKLHPNSDQPANDSRLLQQEQQQ